VSTATIGATLVGDFKPGSDEWLEARRQRVGGSEAAVCLGLSPYESIFSLWHRKAGLIDPIEEDPVMEWGNRLEAAVLAKWCDTHPEFNPVTPGGTWVSESHPFMIANPDALAFTDNGARRELVEVKTSPNGDHFGPAGSDEYPVWYRAQVLHYMHVLNISRAHLIVLISGFDYREYVIEMDEYARQDVQLIIDAEQAFIDSLPGGPAEQRPDIDEHTATYEAVKEMHPDIERGESVEVPAELADAYLDANARFKEAEAEKRGAAARLADFIGNAQYATYDGERIASRQARGEDGTPYLVAARASKQTIRKETRAA
jgi:putative phage-type endonuclease